MHNFMINQFLDFQSPENQRLRSRLVPSHLKLMQLTTRRFVTSIICVFVAGKAFKNETLV